MVERGAGWTLLLVVQVGLGMKYMVSSVIILWALVLLHHLVTK